MGDGDGDGEVQVVHSSGHCLLACLPACMGQRGASHDPSVDPHGALRGFGVRRWRSLVGLSPILTPTFTFTPQFSRIISESTKKTFIILG